MWNNGSWCWSNVRFAPKLGGAIGRCLWCLQFGFMVSHFLEVTIFTRLFVLGFPICLTILCMPILNVFFSSFSTWGFHSHFVTIKYTTRGPTRRSVVCFGTPSCSLPYNSSPPYLCFMFLGEWYTYNRSYIKSGSCVVIIVGGIINIWAFSVTNEVCSLVSIGVKPLYIIFSWLFYFWFGFWYFGRTNGIHIICWILYD